ncbi:SIR2 family protein [Ruminiclostridium cellobioparum]|uniref:Protein argonaute n=1 Tax=Ruminiclostridium cellobioparum subsp. termitidis CT1112 TaxID=1195236 RepID=S0FVJ1_RUMCE|nr:SIR2 family protein [Ruminiclostridium cellobioparum]EMS72563.1 hypothetical protein CTER_1525 [Ruminiclostridium cellobioparum subsp. termitidis CT1112]
MENYILELDEFLRSLKQNKHVAHSMVSGAGASIESGVQSAYDCIWDWKRDIYISQNPAMANVYKNIKLDSIRNAIQQWLDVQSIYSERDSDNEYTFYAEKAYKIPSDRSQYFRSIIDNKTPSLGYNLITFLHQKEMIRTVWTTNFDGLMVKACHQNNITPIEITLESQDRIYRKETKNELLCVALHGDYKYGPLKNTAEELDGQSDKFIEALKHELTNRNLIVIGYSGRDHSLMDALKKAYSGSGAGRLYWCGYGSTMPNNVRTLINYARSQGREAYFIPTDGFDKTMLNICQICYDGDAKAIAEIEKLKKPTGLNIVTSFFNSPSHSGLSNINKIIKSNLFPISLPKTCLQFDIEFPDNESQWDYCKSLMQHNIIAVPGDGTVYAWGDKNTINSVCRDRLKTSIIDIPLTRDSIMKKAYLKEMLLRLIVASIASQCNLSSNNKNRLWDKDIIRFMTNGKNISAYKGIVLSIVFDWKYTYLSINPTYVLPKEILLSKEECKLFADNFYNNVNNGKPNLNYHNYIENWVKKLYKNDRLTLSFPENSPNKVQFLIGGKNLMVGLNSTNATGKLALPAEIAENQIVLEGIEFKDPQLLFYNPSQNRMVKDFHPMRGLQNNQPYDYHMNNKTFKPTISVGILCPTAHNKNFETFINGLNQSYKSNYNIDYVIDYSGFSNIYGVSLNIPSSNRWVDLSSTTQNSSLYDDALLFANQVTHKIEQLSSLPDIDVILIYIPKEFEPYTSYQDEVNHIEFDLHNFVKAFAVQKGISTQFIREKTIESDLSCQIAWSLSLAIYVKALRTPWTLANVEDSTAFAGIGYSISHSENGSEVLVGCSHIYSSDGQGVKYKLSKITDVTYDSKKNPYLSENEAYQLGLNIKELFYKSFTDIPKRVVIHKRTPFKPQEIRGITDSLSGSEINIDLIEIAYEDEAKFFEFGKNYIIDGFPVRRGVCFPINKNTAYLYTHGIAPSVRNPFYKYIKGGKSMPIPLKIVKHYGSGTLEQIAMEILGLSKMNWNSFELYSKLPCTIESSNTIAKIGWMLSQYNGAIYDYRYFM